MEKLEKGITCLARHIGIVIIIFSAAAFIRPSGFAWATDYTAWFLGAAMFGMGLTIKAEDFRAVFAQPKDMILGCIAQYTIMPLAAWGIAAAFHLPADLAVGVILVGCCPGGTASNVITYIAGGDVTLSVGMTIVSTFLAPVMTPLLTYALAGRWVEVSFAAMVLSVTKVILIPVLLGLLLHRVLGRRIEKAVAFVPLISVTAIVMIIAGIIADNVEKIMTCGLLVLAVVILHNFFGLFFGLLIAHVFKEKYEKATAIAIEVGMQNSGLAVSLAAANFAANPLATLPGAIFSVWHNISGSIFASIRRSRNK